MNAISGDWQEKAWIKRNNSIKSVRVVHLVNTQNRVKIDLNFRSYRVKNAFCERSPITATSRTQKGCNMIYGYARVSSREQNLGRQIEALRAEGISERNIITDKQSGKDFDRRGYNSLVGTENTAPLLREGDQLVVLSLDRLGRNYEDIRRQWLRITSELKADIRVLDMPLLDTANSTGTLDSRFVADLVLQILSYVAEKERQSIRERQRQGIELAKAAGKYKGRTPKAYDETLLREECSKWQRGEQTATQTMQNCGLTKTYFYKKVKELGLSPNH